MAIPQNVRASDRPELSNPAGDDFVVRRRFPSVRQMAQICLAAVIVVFGVVILVRNDTLVGSLICVLVGSIMLHLGRNIEKQQKVINATEYMNALFSSALCKGYKFCFVARKDGAIVYLDRGFQEVFPDFMEQPRRELSALSEVYNLSSDVSSKLTEIVTAGSDGQLLLTAATGANKISQTMNVTCETITRPKGYVLVRGK
ncbi:MAG: hypothetical protein LW823_06605 [Rickettsiales bacterium]|jgi:hypothetical protein|nr:hypothetical protein [Rickettsiales bacterium]